uniref:NAC domain-containing protein n=1 Tax=Chenopodium quinoa TaxID=63459 RepID=A0A803N717_CHEQI
GRNSSASTSLAPGFRFHPTDEELVWYYLRRKVSGKPFRVDAISEIDIYKVEPSDLPGLSKLKSRDLEWYFFSALDRKYGNGLRTNRATNEGYWKTTGKDRPVYHKSRVVGMKKTLVYHKGRAPRGERTNWVMHEYKLNDDVLEKAGHMPEGFVLCRVFQKSGTGPKNGEKYGAPLVEEEWEDDSLEDVVPAEVSFEDPYVDDDAYIEQNDLEQCQVVDCQLPANVPFPVSFNPVDSNYYLECSQNVTGAEQASVVEESEGKCGLQVLDDQEFYDLGQDENTAFLVKNEHMAQPNDLSNQAPGDLLDDLLSGNAPPKDGLFLDAVDFLEPVQEDIHDFDVLGSYLEDDFDIGPYLIFDSSPEQIGIDADQSFSFKQNMMDTTWQVPSGSQLNETGDVDDVASSSKAKPSKTDIQYPFLSQANRFLGNIPAPPAFASELPSKDVAARLSAAVQASTTPNVTAGMIRIRDLPIGVIRSGLAGLHWSFDKTGNVNVLLSFDLPEAVNPVGLESLTGLLSRKISTASSHGWLSFMFFLFFAFAASVKVGLYIYAK